jgi:hypothetical protein
VYMQHKQEWFVVLSQSCNLLVWSTVLVYKLRPVHADKGAS